MFKNFKDRVRQSSIHFKTSSIHGIDKLTRAGNKRRSNITSVKEVLNPSNSQSRQSGHNRNDDGTNLDEEQEFHTAPGTVKTSQGSCFDESASVPKPRRPPPVAAGSDLTYSPVLTFQSFPLGEKDEVDENGDGKRDSSSLGGATYHVYDSTVFTGEDEYFNIFEKKGGITPCSSRLVIQCLTSAFKESISNVGDTRILQQVVKPNLHHFSREELEEVRRLICRLFPHDGCTLKDQALKKEVRDSFGNNVVRLTVALRVIWSSFSKGIIPWESYYKFIKWESQTGFPPESFHFRFSKFLPDRDYTFCTFAFLEFLLCILLQKNKLMLDKNIQLDLIYTAGATAFIRDQGYSAPANEEMPPVIRSYHQRGFALQRLFVGYIRSLCHERKMTDVYLLDIFQVERYPPKPYNARSAKALTLTIPKGDPNGNDFTSLINKAATAKKRFYSPNASFSRIENAFLDQFEEQTLRVIMTFFSESSNRYITAFDNDFQADVLQNGGDSKRNKHDNYHKVNEDDNMIATWLQMAKEQNGFDELLDVLENNHIPEGGTLALGAPAATMGPTSRKDRGDKSSNGSVRVGKTDITEWIINSWKYEMFMGRVQNTLLIKLTKKVDECNWLVLSCEENFNMASDRLPPPPKLPPSAPPVPKVRPSQLAQSRRATTQPFVLPPVGDTIPTFLLPNLPPIDIPLPDPFTEPIVGPEPDPEPEPICKPVRQLTKDSIGTRVTIKETTVPPSIVTTKNSSRDSAIYSMPSNDNETLIAKLNNIDITSSASDTSNERDAFRTIRSSHNVLGDLLESCYSANELEV